MISTQKMVLQMILRACKIADYFFGPIHVTSGHNDTRCIYSVNSSISLL